MTRCMRKPPSVHILRQFSALALTCAISASCSPKMFESPVVLVASGHDWVACQLYTKELSAWDRSVRRPDNMSTDDADKICVREGLAKNAFD